MDRNSGKESIWKIISMAGFASTFQYIPPKMQLIILVVLFIVIIRDFIKDRERGYSNTPLYIYVCSIPVGFLAMSYIIDIRCNVNI